MIEINGVLVGGGKHRVVLLGVCARDYVRHGSGPRRATGRVSCRNPPSLWTTLWVTHDPAPQSRALTGPETVCPKLEH
jgi:hypothetical protein